MNIDRSLKAAAQPKGNNKGFFFHLALAAQNAYFFKMINEPLGVKLFCATLCNAS